MKIRIFVNILSILPVALFLFIGGCNNPAEPEEPPPGPPWVTFRRPSTAPLLDNKINALTVDGSNRVWVATDSGANYFLKGGWGIIRDSLRYITFGTTGQDTSYKVNWIEPGKESSIWFGLAGGGVKRYREGASRNIWQTYNPPHVSSNVIQSIAADKLVNGDVWVSTTSGISRFMPRANPEFGDWYQYNTAPPLPNTIVYCSTIDVGDNTVWFGTQNGFARYSDQTGDWTPYELPTDYNSKINSISIDLLGKVWLGKVVGVSFYDRSTSGYTHYTNESTGGLLPPGEVHAVTTDLATTRWFGTDQGLICLSDTTWTTFNTSNTPELASDHIRALTYDKRGNLWIGTDNGLTVYNPTGTRF